VSTRSLRLSKCPARSFLVREEVEDIPEFAAFGLVEFRKLALHARNGREAFRLNVEYLGEEASGGAKLVDLVCRAAAFGALEFESLHCSSR
jgi:hypothetical protein